MDRRIFKHFQAVSPLFIGRVTSSSVVKYRHNKLFRTTAASTISHHQRHRLMTTITTSTSSGSGNKDSCTPSPPRCPTTKSLVETKQFYEEQANIYRHYFYIVDSRGRVYLEDCKHHNFITQLRDQVFLRMLFSLQRFNKSPYFQNESPFLSPCGKESNYMRYEDKRCVLVFGRLQRDDDRVTATKEASDIERIGSDMGVSDNGMSQIVDKDDEEKRVALGLQDTYQSHSLFIGQSLLLKHPFDPSMLYVDDVTGRFYHRVTTHKYLCGEKGSDEEHASDNVKLGLLHPLITQQLSELLIYDEVKEQFVLKWQEKLFPVTRLVD